MSAEFFDTNVLLYLASRDAEKADRAESLLENRGTISVQVLNEIANVARRKLQLPWDEVRSLLQTVSQLFDIVPLTVETHELGLDVAERYQLSVYDGQIIAAALLAECSTLWSEDMQDGLVIQGRMKIANPFS
jgi:predicted nucleic acid-binding protein